MQPKMSDWISKQRWVVLSRCSEQVKSSQEPESQPQLCQAPKILTSAPQSKHGGWLDPGAVEGGSKHVTVSRRGPQVSSIVQSHLGSSVEAERPAGSWARSGALTEIWGLLCPG